MNAVPLMFLIAVLQSGFSTGGDPVPKEQPETQIVISTGSCTSEGWTSRLGVLGDRLLDDGTRGATDGPGAMPVGPRLVQQQGLRPVAPPCDGRGQDRADGPSICLLPPQRLVLPGSEHEAPLVELAFRNDGVSDLVILGVQPACGAVVTSYTPIVRPGQGGTMGFRLSAEPQGQRLSGVRVCTNVAGWESVWLPVEVPQR